MSFQINANNSLSESIGALVCDEIQAAIAACCSEDNGKGSSVHNTRRHLKRARAALQLLSCGAPRKALRSENGRLRDVGRLISSIRDAEVRLATINDLRKALGCERSGNLEETEELLAFELDSFVAAFDGWQGEAADKMRRAQTVIGEWDLQDIPPEQILRSLRISYRNGRVALDEVRKKGDARRFHKLRKRAKELWLQLRLLRPLAPQAFRELSGELKKLVADLGHAHDLCFVAERLYDLAGMHPRQRNRKMLAALIKSRERDLQRRAVRVAECSYKKKPKKFAARLRKHFKNGKRPNERNSSQAASVLAKIPPVAQPQ